MKWNDCKGSYEAFISLGSTCQTSFQLKRLQLRKFAGPLDWFISRPVPHVARLIRNRFKGFMEFDRLQLLGRNSTNYIIRDYDYDIISYHDFPLFYRWTDAYPDFKQKIDRRTNAFLTAVKKSPICFIRINTSMMDAQHLYAALKSIMPGNFRLLIVNNSDYIHEVRHEDWGIHHIGSVSVPSGTDWRGSNFAWNEIMDGFKLKSGFEWP